MLLFDLISPSAAAAANLTSGCSSASALLATFRALGSPGTKPKTRIAMTRSLVLLPLHPASRINHACSFGVRRPLGGVMGGGPGSLACGSVAPGFIGTAPGVADCGFAGVCCAGAFGGGGETGVDGCCANGKHEAQSTRRKTPALVTFLMTASLWTTSGPNAIFHPFSRLPWSSHADHPVFLTAQLVIIHEEFFQLAQELLAQIVDMLDISKTVIFALDRDNSIVALLVLLVPLLAFNDSNQATLQHASR